MAQRLTFNWDKLPKPQHSGWQWLRLEASGAEEEIAYHDDHQ
jgi:hypothetical protein